MSINTEDKNRWTELGSQIQTFVQWSISSLVDSAFLAFWVLLQWFVDVKVIQSFELSEIDTWILFAFQIIFAVSTIIPVAIFIYTDINIMFFRAKRRIQREAEIDKENNNNGS